MATRLSREFPQIPPRAKRSGEAAKSGIDSSAFLFVIPLLDSSRQGGLGSGSPLRL